MDKTKPQSNSLEIAAIYKPAPLSLHDYLLLSTFSFINAVIGAAYCVLAPFFPKEAESKGLSPSTIGILFAIQEVVVFILCPIYGILLPKFGFRRTLLFGSVVAAAGLTSFGALKWSPGGSTFTILSAIIRAFGSLGVAALSSASYAAIPVYYPGYVSKLFGLLEMSYCIGMIIGPTLGGWLYEVGGFDLPMYFCGGLMALVFPAIFILFPRIERLPKNEKSAGILKILSNYRITLMIIINLECCIVFGFNQSTLEPHVRGFANIGASAMGLIFLSCGLFYGLATWSAGFFLNKFEDVTFMSLLGLGLSTAAYIFIGPMYPVPLKPTVPLVVVAQILYGTGCAICLVSCYTQTMREKDMSDLKTDIGAGSLISSIFVSAYALGSAIGPIFGGYLLEHLNYAQSCLVVNAMHLALILVIIGTILFHKRSYETRASQSGVTDGSMNSVRY